MFVSALSTDVGFQLTDKRLHRNKTRGSIVLSSLIFCSEQLRNQRANALKQKSGQKQIAKREWVSP